MRISSRSGNSLYYMRCSINLSSKWIEIPTRMNFSTLFHLYFALDFSKRMVYNNKSHDWSLSSERQSFSWEYTWNFKTISKTLDDDEALIDLCKAKKKFIKRQEFPKKGGRSEKEGNGKKARKIVCNSTAEYVPEKGARAPKRCPGICRRETLFTTSILLAVVRAMRNERYKVYRLYLKIIFQ